MKVWVEIDPDTDLPIRIFKNVKLARKHPNQENVFQLDRALSIAAIRRQVIYRARRHRNRLIKCEFCGKVITEQTGHMHEVLPRGKGGEYSVDNSRFICAQCHIGPDGEHGDRKFQTSKIRAKPKPVGEQIPPTKGRSGT